MLFKIHLEASLIAQSENLRAVQETRVQSLDQEDPLEKEMATDSSILAWRIPWAEEPGELQSLESQGVGQTEHSCTLLASGHHW